MIRDHENKLTTDKKYFEKQRKFKNQKKTYMLNAMNNSPKHIQSPAKQK